MLVTNLINIDNTIDKDIQNTNGDELIIIKKFYYKM